MFYVSWTINRVIRLIWRGQRDGLLTRHLAMPCILPAAVWDDIVPWLAWKIAGTSLGLLQSLPLLLLHISVACMVIAVAYEQHSDSIRRSVRKGIKRAIWGRAGSIVREATRRRLYDGPLQRSLIVMALLVNLEINIELERNSGIEIESWLVMIIA